MANRKKGTIVAFIIIDILLLLAICVVTLLYFKNRRKVEGVQKTTVEILSDYDDEIDEEDPYENEDPGVAEEPMEGSELYSGDTSIYDIPFDDGYEFPDLSQWEFVFIGDSIFDMYSSLTSMPRQLEVYTQSRVYNISKNMSCAGNSSNNVTSLTGLTESFLQKKDISSEGGSISNELSRFKKDKHKGKRMAIVIDHCINDYTFSTAISNPADANDINSYEGALRSNISKLKAKYPDAVVIFMKPYIFGVNNCGSDLNYIGYTIDDYISAAEKVAGELDVRIFDLRSYAFFAEYREGYLLDDYLHPNDMCSKTMVRLFCDYLLNNIN